MTVAAPPAELDAELSGRPRADAIAETLRRWIATLVFPPGALLKEVELAEHFEVSRTPIRQVLQQLQFEQLVESRRGVGTLVTEIDFEGLEEVYALRVRLAELIGDLSPEAPRPELLARLRALRARALEAPFEPRRFAELNLDAHELLTELVGNRPLRATIRQLFHRTARIWMSWGDDIDGPAELEIHHRELGEILACLEAGDVRSAGFAHRNHIALSLGRIRRYAARRS